MTATCTYHPGFPAVADCAQCQSPICQSCAQTVAGKTVCVSCVEAIRARVAAESPAASPYAASAAAAHPSRLALGALLGLAVGIVGAIIWEKVVYYSHFNIGYLTALIGFGVGWGVLTGGKRTGLVPAIIGAVIAFIAQIFGYCLLAADEVGHGVSVMTLLLSPRGLGLVVKSLDVLDWVILAIGVYGGFKTPYRAGSAPGNSTRR